MRPFVFHRFHEIIPGMLRRGKMRAEIRNVGWEIRFMYCNLDLRQQNYTKWKWD